MPVDLTGEASLPYRALAGVPQGVPVSAMTGTMHAACSVARTAVSAAGAGGPGREYRYRSAGLRARTHPLILSSQLAQAQADYAAWPAPRPSRLLGSHWQTAVSHTEHNHLGSRTHKNKGTAAESRRSYQKSIPVRRPQQADSQEADGIGGGRGSCLLWSGASAADLVIAAVVRIPVGFGSLVALFDASASSLRADEAAAPGSLLAAAVVVGTAVTERPQVTAAGPFQLLRRVFWNRQAFAARCETSRQHVACALCVLCHRVWSLGMFTSALHSRPLDAVCRSSARCTRPAHFKQDAQ